jgi:hypothetical protein
MKEKKHACIISKFPFLFCFLTQIVHCHRVIDVVCQGAYGNNMSSFSNDDSSFV